MVIQNLFALILVVTSIAVLWYNYWWASKGHKFFIRKLPALDAISEALSRCAELGVPAYFPMSGGPVEQAQSGPSHLAALSIMGYATKPASEMGVKILVGTVQPPLIAMSDDVLTEGYRINGAPELHKLEDVMYYPGQMQIVAGSDSLFKQYKMASTFMLGSWWADTPAMCEVVKRHDSFLIGGTEYIENVSYLVAFSDYALVFEEIYAAGAYISDDEKLKSSIFSEDIIKMIVIALTIVGAIAVSAGMRDFLKWIAM